MWLFPKSSGTIGRRARRDTSSVRLIPPAGILTECRSQRVLVRHAPCIEACSKPRTRSGTRQTGPPRARAAVNASWDEPFVERIVLEKAVRPRREARPNIELAYRSCNSAYIPRRLLRLVRLYEPKLVSGALDPASPRTEGRCHDVAGSAAKAISNGTGTRVGARSPVALAKRDIQQVRRDPEMGMSCAGKHSMSSKMELERRATRDMRRRWS